VWAPALLVLDVLQAELRVTHEQWRRGERVSASVFTQDAHMRVTKTRTHAHTHTHTCWSNGSLLCSLNLPLSNEASAHNRAMSGTLTYSQPTRSAHTREHVVEEEEIVRQVAPPAQLDQHAAGEDFAAGIIGLRAAGVGPCAHAVAAAHSPAQVTR
jgi:hypothetical protein